MLRKSSVAQKKVAWFRSREMPSSRYWNAAPGKKKTFPMPWKELLTVFMEVLMYSSFLLARESAGKGHKSRIHLMPRKEKLQMHKFPAQTGCHMRKPKCESELAHFNSALKKLEPPPKAWLAPCRNLFCFDFMPLTPRQAFSSVMSCDQKAGPRSVCA